MYQHDLKSSFMIGVLKKDIYVQFPQGYEVIENGPKVYKYKKSLDRLKSSPRTWKSRVDNYFI